MNLEEEEESHLTFGNLSQTDVKKMVDKYHKNAKKHPEYEKDKHVRCVWFPIAQIERIYCYLKLEGADGLRVYFGNYPDKDEKGNDFENPNTNTVVFVSTKGGKNDYYTFTKITEEKEKHFTRIEEKNIPPENRGEQCEPKCEGENIAIKE